MDKLYLIPPAFFSLALYAVALGIIAVNLCDYSDSWSIILNWGLVLFLLYLFNIYVFIPYALLWWGSLFCKTDGYSITSVLVLTGVIFTASFVTTLVKQIYDHSGKPDKTSGKKEPNIGLMLKYMLFSIVSPPSAIIIGGATMIGIISNLSSKK